MRLLIEGETLTTPVASQDHASRRRRKAAGDPARRRQASGPDCSAASGRSPLKSASVIPAISRFTCSTWTGLCSIPPPIFAAPFRAFSATTRQSRRHRRVSAALHRPSSVSICSRICFPDRTREQMDADDRRLSHASTWREVTRRREPYPGIAEALAALPGRKSTATTKGTPTTRAVLEMFGLLPYFDHVQGTDGFPAKPEPDVILASLEVFGVQPEDCLFVGDSRSRHGSRPPRGRQDLRGAVGLRRSRGHGALGAGLLDRASERATCLEPRVLPDSAGRCRSPCRARRECRACAARWISSMVVMPPAAVSSCLVAARRRRNQSRSVPCSMPSLST